MNSLLNVIVAQNLFPKVICEVIERYCNKPKSLKVLLQDQVRCIAWQHPFANYFEKYPIDPGDEEETWLTKWEEFEQACFSMEVRLAEQSWNDFTVRRVGEDTYQYLYTYGCEEYSLKECLALLDVIFQAGNEFGKELQEKYTQGKVDVCINRQN